MAIMLGDNKIWKSKFNPTSLEGEDWLDPSDNLFDAIESVVYDEAPKKEKRSLLWIVLLVGLVGLSSLAVILNLDNYTEVSDNSAVSQAAPLPPYTKPKKAIPLSSSSITQSPAQNTTQQVVQILQTDQSSQKKNISNQTAKIFSDNSKAVFSSGSNNSSLNNKVWSIMPDNNKEILSGQVEESNKQTSQSQASSNKKNNSISRLDNKQRVLPNLIDRLPLVRTALAYQSPTPHLFLEIEENIKVYNSELKSGFLFTVGQSYTHFDLSQSFDPLVAAADFRSSNGNGYSAFFGYEKSINSRIEFNGAISLSQTTFTSGHNSAYNYQQGPSNQVDLAMATPLGFMDGGFLITDNAGLNEDADLVLDLFNHHRYRTVGLDLGLAYRLFEFGHLSVKLEGGLGVQRFFGFHNNLDEVVSSDPNFSSSNTNISSTLEDINKLMAMATVGLRLEQSISASHSLLFRYQAFRGLQNLHETTDYSTGLLRQNVSVGLKWFVR